MPRGIDRFCLSIEDILAATEFKWRIYRTRSIVECLPSIDGPKTGGRPCKLYRASDVLLRCRNHRRWLSDYTANLLHIIKTKEFSDAT